MRTEIYTRFSSLVQTGLYASYEEICRVLHVCPDDLDELLEAELGCSGSQLVDYFGNQQ